MTTVRTVKSVLGSKPTVEGAGVRLKRAIGYEHVPQFDPYLLLDDFRSDDPNEYLAGFPWHPHRGIETITYVLRGSVEHGDSLGNKGMISSGDVQCMTAGSGIVHQEMPHSRDDGVLSGFQLWANLPASHKMMPPRYRDVGHAQIPEVEMEGGTTVKIISGTVSGVEGPVRDVVTDPAYLDVTVPRGGGFTHSVPVHHTAFAYVIEGRGRFGPSPDPHGSDIGHESVVLFSDGDTVSVSASGEGVRFLLISGRPIGEPVAWGGPIVMNTREELRVAFEEYRNGTFLKHGGRRSIPSARP